MWAVTLIGGLFITVLSFIMIMTVYGRFFKLYLYTAIAPVPLSAFAGEPSQNIGKSFIKSYAAVCLRVRLSYWPASSFPCFASSPPVVDPDAAAVTQVGRMWASLIFNMLVLVGAVKMADRVVREMMGFFLFRAIIYKKKKERILEGFKVPFESSKMVEAIPMGQPLLVDHYSYKSDKNYRDRAGAKWRNPWRQVKKADYYRSKAEAAEKNTAISSDDPEAVTKLKEKNCSSGKTCKAI